MPPSHAEFTVGDRTVRVSNPDKIYFPQRGLTKVDLVRYFLAVGEGVLAALRDRPTTLERWPSGVFEGARRATRTDSRGDAFFQKRVPGGAPPWVQTARVGFPSGRHADEICPTELAVVIWAANLATLTFHPWPVRRPDLEHPDQLRIDLDPQPGTDFADAVRVARELRGALAELGLAGYPKTSGGRGVHVYVPIEPRWTFTEVRRGLIALAREMQRRMPQYVTTNWWKEERGARIFIDYNQAARDRTFASAYSVRPHARALVSAPVRWDELDDAVPEDFDVTTLPARFAEVGDVHAGMFEQRFSIQPLLDMADRDERDQGLGDLPYPPEHPKAGGEPARVQPSRARRPPAS